MIIGILIAGVTLVAGLYNLDKGEISFWMVLCGVVIGMCSMLFGIITIHCPKCGEKWIWSAIRTQPAGHWLGSIMHDRGCTVCGSRFE